MIVLLSLLVCIVGLILFLASTSTAPPNPPSPRLAQIGFAMFQVGLFAFLLQSAQLVDLLPRLTR